MEIENFASILKKEKEFFIANQDKITDFNDGSMIETLFESFAVVLEDLYIKARNGYITNLKNIVYSFFNFVPHSGTRAIGEVKFSRSDAISSATIPIGTKVTAGDLIYETTSTCIIKASETTATVGIKAVNIGTKYNVDANKINLIASIVPFDVTTVTNEAAITGGLDGETEIETFKRFKEYINGLQGISEYGLTSAIMNDENTGVKKIKVVEHFPPENNNNFTIYVYDGAGTATYNESLIKQIVDGDKTKTYPGKKAVGMNYDISTVVQNKVKIKVVVTLQSTNNSFDNDIKEQINNYIDEMEIGQPLYKSAIVACIRSLSYIEDVSITLNEDATKEVVTPTNTQIIAIDTITIEKDS